MTWMACVAPLGAEGEKLPGLMGFCFEGEGSDRALKAKPFESQL